MVSSWSAVCIFHCLFEKDGENIMQIWMNKLYTAHKRVTQTLENKIHHARLKFTMQPGRVVIEHQESVHKSVYIRCSH